MPAILFDLFGTLIDLKSDEDAHLELARRLSELHKGAFSPPELHEIYKELESQGLESVDAVMKALEELSRKRGFKVSVSREFVEALHRELHIEYVYPVPRVHEAVMLARRLCGKVALVSDADDVVARRIMDKLGVLNLFDAVVTSGALGVRKPDPRLFLEAAARLGVTPGECVVIGDSWRDVEGAHRSGMKVVLIKGREYRGPEPDEKAHNLVEAVMIAARILGCSPNTSSKLM